MKGDQDIRVTKGHVARKRPCQLEQKEKERGHSPPMGKKAAYCSWGRIVRKREAGDHVSGRGRKA